MTFGKNSLNIAFMLLNGGVEKSETGCLGLVIKPLNLLLIPADFIKGIQSQSDAEKALKANRLVKNFAIARTLAVALFANEFAIAIQNRVIEGAAIVLTAFYAGDLIVGLIRYSLINQGVIGMGIKD